MIRSCLPARAGLGFKPQHYHDALGAPCALGFFEVHAENYMGAGGAPHAMLERLHRDHALSVHGVGLSIGGAGPRTRTIWPGWRPCWSVTSPRVSPSTWPGPRMGRLG